MTRTADGMIGAVHAIMPPSSGAATSDPAVAPDGEATTRSCDVTPQTSNVEPESVWIGVPTGGAPLLDPLPPLLEPVAASPGPPLLEPVAASPGPLLVGPWIDA